MRIGILVLDTIYQMPILNGKKLSYRKSLVSYCIIFLDLLKFKILMTLTFVLHGLIRTMVVSYLFVKFLKLAVLNFTKLGPWEAGNICSIVENIDKALDCSGNIDIISCHEHFEGANLYVSTRFASVCFCSYEHFCPSPMRFHCMLIEPSAF